MSEADPEQFYGVVCVSREQRPAEMQQRQLEV